MPISSSLPENVASRRRRTVIWSSSDVVPMRMKRYGEGARIICMLDYKGRERGLE